MIKCQIIFYAANKASESFVSSAVRMLLLSSGKFSLWLFNFDYKYLDSGHTRPPVLEKKRFLIYFTSSGSEKEFYKNCFEIISSAKHLCFNVLGDLCTMIDTTSCLPADYNNYGFSRKFPRLCQEWPKIFNTFLIIYNEHKQRQTKYRFFYFLPHQQ